MLNWILSTSALIAVILLVRRLLRGRMDPRLTCALWLLAALRVLIPVQLFSAPVSVSGLAERTGAAEAVEAARYETRLETAYASGASGSGDDGGLSALQRKAAGLSQSRRTASPGAFWRRRTEERVCLTACSGRRIRRWYRGLPMGSS